MFRTPSQIENSIRSKRPKTPNQIIFDTVISLDSKTGKPIKSDEIQQRRDLGLKLYNILVKPDERDSISAEELQTRLMSGLRLVESIINPQRLSTISEDELTQLIIDDAQRKESISGSLQRFATAMTNPYNSASKSE